MHTLLSVFLNIVTCIHVCSYVCMYTPVSWHHCNYQCFLYQDQQLKFIGRLFYFSRLFTVLIKDCCLAIVFVIVLPNKLFLSAVCFPPLTVLVTTKEGVWRSGPRRPRSHDPFHLSHLPQVLVCWWYLRVCSAVCLCYCFRLFTHALRRHKRMKIEWEDHHISCFVEYMRLKPYLVCWCMSQDNH